MSGKGDKRRPTKVDQDTFASNWERIFGKKNESTTNESKEGDDRDSREESKDELR